MAREYPLAGLHQSELQALEAAAIATMQRERDERDERIASARDAGERELEARLHSERRRAAEEREADAVAFQRLMEAAAGAYSSLSASELRTVEEEASRAYALGKASAGNVQYGACLLTPLSIPGVRASG